MVDRWNYALYVIECGKNYDRCSCGDAAVVHDEELAAHIETNPSTKD